MLTGGGFFVYIVVHINKTGRAWSFCHYFRYGMCTATEVKRDAIVFDLNSVSFI
jgi:hypothetical protein